MVTPAHPIVQIVRRSWHHGEAGGYRGTARCEL